MYNHKIFSVGNATGGFGDATDWLEAAELARELSQNNQFATVYDHDDDKIVCVYHDGNMYVAAYETVCEACGLVIDEGMYHYSYRMTGRRFCTSECGIKLGVLVDPFPKP